MDHLCNKSSVAFSVARAVTASTETTVPFWEAAQAVEMPKDYAFALGGVATYLIKEKIGRRNSLGVNRPRCKAGSIRVDQPQGGVGLPVSD